MRPAVSPGENGLAGLCEQGLGRILHTPLVSMYAELVFGSSRCVNPGGRLDSEYPVPVELFSVKADIGHVRGPSC